MALLEEEPIDIPNNAEDIGNNEETHDDKENIPNNERNNAEEPQDIEREPAAKRKPGRPAGSRNKEQGKARPGARKPRVKKVEVVEEPIEEVSFEDPEPQYQRIPTVATTSKEERMLRLLSDHAKSRRARKVALWKSWF